MATKKVYKTNRVVPPREKNVQVRLTDEEHEKLMRYARKSESSAGKILRELLREAGII
jgi:hypothetical protein